MLLSIGWLIGGLLGLVFAGDWLVKGAVSFALKVGVSRLLASILIVGFGTSAPEMLVAVEASLDGKPGLAFGNIVGSNIANVMLVLGIPAIFLTIRTIGAGLQRSVLFTGAATVAWILITQTIGLSPLIGIIFLGTLLAYILSSLVFPPGGDTSALIEDDVNDDPMGWLMTSFFIALGIVGLPLAAHFAILGATGIATEFGLSDALIGLTIIAIGTSLPEIAAAMAATFRKENDMILGSIAGSNMFNILGAGGIIALLPAFSSNVEIVLPSLFTTYDHWIFGGVFALFALLVFLKTNISRWIGLAFVVAYIAYLVGLYHFHYLGLGWSDIWN